MKKIIGLFLLIWAIGSAQVSAQSETNRLDSIMPVRGLAIAAPSAQKLDLFLKFVQEELAPSHFNLLILRVDWNYAYESHPELRDPTPLTREDVKKIVKVCRDNGIRIAPQINLLGHQSWAETTYALLREYPEFDETPHVDTKNYMGAVLSLFGNACRKWRTANLIRGAFVQDGADCIPDPSGSQLFRRIWPAGIWIQR